MKYVLWVCCVLGVLSVRGQSFRLESFGSDTIPVTARKMTSVIFPVEIGAGIWVTRDVLVQRVKGVRNAIELKAERRDFMPTNLAVYGKDGRLYSFALRYVEDTSVLNFMVSPSGARAVMLTDLPVGLPELDADAALLGHRPAFVHVSAVSDGLRLRLAGIWSRDSLMWLVLRLRNRVPVGLGPCSVRLYVEDKKQIKRMATQEVDVAPVYGGSLEGLAGDASLFMVVGLRPVFVPSRKRLVVELTAADRSVLVRVKGKVLRKVRRG
jgi:Domain of unknown function (DUF4138)